jgi:predicted nucleic acid-binding protein
MRHRQSVRSASIRIRLRRLRIDAIGKGSTPVFKNVCCCRDRVRIEIGGTVAIMLARRKNYPVLLDDLAARRFATGLGLEVTGSIRCLNPIRKESETIEERGTGCAGEACTGDVAQHRCL